MTAAVIVLIFNLYLDTEEEKMLNIIRLIFFHCHSNIFMNLLILKKQNFLYLYIYLFIGSVKFFLVMQYVSR